MAVFPNLRDGMGESLNPAHLAANRISDESAV